jgi:hypothetical protein
MAKYQARVKMEFGEIVVNFDTVAELKSNLEALDITSASEALREKFKGAISVERKPKTGCEKYYRFSPSGLVEVTSFPETLSKPELIAFVLYAYHPEAASSQDISLSSGVREAIKYLTQTAYKKIWWKTQDGNYVLSDEGIKLVSAKVLPKFRGIETTKDEQINAAK